MPFKMKVSRPWHQCLLAIITVAAAAAVRAEFLGFLGPRLPFVTFAPAVLFVTLFANFPSGLLATFLTLVYAACRMVDPFDQIMVIRNPTDRLVLAASTASLFAISFVALALHHAQRRVAEAEAQAKLFEQQRMSEAELRESEARYRVLFENSLDAIFLTLPSGEVTSANRAACALFGMSEAELCRAGRAGILDEVDEVDEAKPGLPVAQQQRVDPGGAMCELTCMRKDGTRFPAEISSVLLDDGLSSFTILRDITERKLAEEELRRSEDKFRGIFENAPLGIFQSAPQGRFISVNPSTARLFGFQDPSSMVETARDDVRQFFQHPEQRDSILQRTLDSGGYAQGEVDLCRKDGSHFVANLYLRAVQSDGGAFLEGFVEDISARKEAEEALQKSELQFRQMAQTIEEVFWLSSPDCVIYASPAFERIWGRSCSELYGSASLWMAAILPEDLPKVRRDIEDRYRGRATEMEYRIARPDGTLRWVSDRGYPLRDASGRVTLLSGVASDITERKQAEVTLKRYARRLIVLEENLRKRIAAELHDDIAQVVTALGLNLSYLGTCLGEDAGNNLRSRLEDSRRLAKEISRTVRNLMVELRPVQLEEYGLVAAIRSHAELYGQRTGIDISVHADPLFPRLAAKKEIALFRIAQEALVNVAKHATATKVVVELSSSAGCIGLSITDDGKGFLPGPSSPLPAGSGWGLTIMRERAELVGGRFLLQTVPGQGTSILVEIKPG